MLGAGEHNPATDFRCVDVNDHSAELRALEAEGDGAAAERHPARPLRGGDEELDVARLPPQVELRAVRDEPAGAPGMLQLVDAPPGVAHAQAERDRDWHNRSSGRASAPQAASV